MTDSQWQYIEKILDDKRKRKHSLRTILNAIFWLNHSGAQWRMLDSKYPPYQTVFYHFTQFKRRGIWEQLMDTLVVDERKKAGKSASPDLLAVDSQAVKTVPFVGEETGIDGGKKINGRKRTIFVDESGLAFAILVRAANISDNQAGILAAEYLRGKVEKLKKIAADRGYKNAFCDHMKSEFGCETEIAQRPESAQGFIPEPDRWQVERSFGWLNFRRRMFREVEKTIESAEAMLQIAFITFSINKL